MAVTLVLDRPHFDAMTGGDFALQLEIVGLFRAQVEGWRSACVGGGEWRDEVHRLKGSARGIGLSALADACAAAEQADAAHQADALQAVRRCLDDAVVELERFAAEAA